MESEIFDRVAVRFPITRWEVEQVFRALGSVVRLEAICSLSAYGFRVNELVLIAELCREEGLV